MNPPRLAIAACLASFLYAGCKGTPAPRPAAVGDWHVAGGSSETFQSTDGGDFGDTDQFSVDLSAGKFLAEGLLVEGLLVVSHSSAEDTAGDDTELTLAAAGAGVRYFTETVSARRPYVGVAVGLADFDFEDDALGVDDSDTALFVQGHAGLESFLSDSVALDVGDFLRQVMNLEIEGVEDDLTTFGLSAGLSVWF